MRSVNMYSSTPLSTELSCAVQELLRQGLKVVVRPLSELPTANTRKQLLRLREERYGVNQELANIGNKLDLHEQGRLHLTAGEELGLRAERDSLWARLRGLTASIRALEGGPADG
jgi:hypothetical protein